MPSDPVATPVLRYRAFARIFDNLIAKAVGEPKVRHIVEHLADVRPGSWVLDVGSSTGTLALFIKTLNPSARVVRIEGDPEILEMARQAARDPKIDVELFPASSRTLPFDDGAFDVVASSLAFNYLPRPAKKAVLSELHRLSRPGGTLFFVNWENPAALSKPLQLVSVPLLDGFETTAKSIRIVIAQYAEEAGFKDFKEVARQSTVHGVPVFYQGKRSE